MGAGLKREDLQTRSRIALEDAKLLLENKRYSNAYYLSGYAVELGLKACIAKQISPETIPDKDLMKNIIRHNFKTLVGLAGLASELKQEQDADKTFASFWGILGEWSPDSRYEAKDPTSTQLIIEAIGNKKSGVLEWIKRYW